MATCLFGKQHNRPILPSLLHYAEGRFDPELTRMARLYTYWQRHGQSFDISAHYWDIAHELPARRGPVQLLKNLLREYGIEPLQPFLWKVDHTTINVDLTPDKINTFLRHTRNALWGKLAREREYYRGMEKGRDEQSTHAIREQLDEKRRAYLDIIQTDAVYTPARAHLRWGKQGHCPKCNNPTGDWKHYVDQCHATPRHAAGNPPGPDCLRYTGTVPTGYASLPLSLEQRQFAQRPQGCRHHHCCY